MRTTLGPVTPDCRRRLTDHYDIAVTDWLDRVPEIFEAAARSWGLELRGYHDAGHASALALAEADEGGTVLLKAWFERGRYRHETAALRHWEPVNGQIVRAQDDEQAVACLELVGGVPGGCSRPAADERAVAETLARLHTHPDPETPFPRLDEYLRRTVEPRILRRLRRYGTEVPRQCIDLGLNAVSSPVREHKVLLHADLYRENVPVNGDGKPVFLDPLAMVGDPAFDWAFFVVYFALAEDPLPRLQAAAEVGDVATRALLPWCLALCLDGLLYYREVGDDREPRMVGVMTTLARSEAGAALATVSGTLR